MHRELCSPPLSRHAAAPELSSSTLPTYRHDAVSGLNLEVTLSTGDYKGQTKGDVPDGDGFLTMKLDASVMKMPVGPPVDVFGGTYDGNFSVGKFSGPGVFMFPETSTLRSYKVRVFSFFGRPQMLGDLVLACPFLTGPGLLALLSNPSRWIAGLVRGGQDSRLRCARVARWRHALRDIPRRPRAHGGQHLGDADVSCTRCVRDHAPRPLAKERCPPPQWGVLRP